MKKIMFIVAAALMAFGVQAAEVTWSSGAFNGPSGASSKTGLKYSDVYSAVITFFSDSAGTSAIGTDSTTDVNAKGLMKGSVDITEPANGVTKTYYAQLVITDISSGKTMSSNIAAFDWTGGQLASPDLAFYGTSAKGFNANPTAGEWSSETPTPPPTTPEPTSGLLLVVGAGLLGLRRKQK